jgi:MoxR-like ATPase
MTQQPAPQKIRINKPITLEKCQAWPESHHVFDEETAFALEMALATGRPLLVRGEPGIGKSQLARAAAHELKRCFISEVVNISLEGQDLLWRYDPVARLNDAQLVVAENAAEKASEKAAEKEKQAGTDQKDKCLQTADLLQPGNYISPGVLWWVFDCTSALDQYKRCRYPFYLPRFDIRKPETADREKQDAQEEDCTCDTLPDACNPAWQQQIQTAAAKGFVLLIDEIDKADPSLPNSLLEVLGNGGFRVPMLNIPVGQGKGNAQPLVIITTNEERELPPAFIRRCLVLNMQLDDKERLRAWWKQQAEKEPKAFPAEGFAPETALKKWLSARAEVHFPACFTAKVKEEAAELLIKDRDKAKQHGTVKPGQAEYLDLLQALQEMTDQNQGKDEQETYQLALLQKISPFALAKAPLA